MASSRKNKTLYIDTEALSSLALVQEGLLAPVTGLMSRKEAEEVDKTHRYHGIPLPFSFILAPKGTHNHRNLKQFRTGEEVDLISGDKKV